MDIFRKNFIKNGISVLLVCGAISVACVAATLPEPVLVGDKVPKPTFGDARSVTLLGDLLTDADVRVRERAARELGQTHNIAAMPYLQRAGKDTSPAVRAAAVRGAGELAREIDSKRRAFDLIVDGLKDPDENVILSSLDGVTVFRRTGAVDTLESLATDKRELIRCSALRALSRFHRGAKPATLKTLLDDPSVAVRVAALDNARRHKTADKELIERFVQLAESENPPAVQAAAIECLGKFVYDPTLQNPIAATAPATQRLVWAYSYTYAKIADNANPLLRRAVVRTYRHHKLPMKILPFLNDPSALVRLAGVEALVDLPTPAAVMPLMNIFLKAKDTQTHQAAYKALCRIGSPQVAAQAAAQLPDIVSALTVNRHAQASVTKTMNAYQKLGGGKKGKVDPKTRNALDMLQSQNARLKQQKELLQRNAISCLRLLATLRSKKGFSYLLGQLPSLPIDSPVLGELALALGAVGDRRATAPLRTVLDACRKQAGPYLRALASMSTPPPFSEKITGRVIEALAMLGDTESVDTIIRLAMTRSGMMRLDDVAAYAAHALPKLATDASRANIEKMLLAVLANESFRPFAQWQAAKAAGQMKIAAASPALKRILYEDRECPAMMNVSAWAIQQITGQAQPPSIPQPQLRQGPWIITQIKD